MIPMIILYLISVLITVPYSLFFMIYVMMALGIISMIRVQNERNDEIYNRIQNIRYMSNLFANLFANLYSYDGVLTEC
jgi:predicted membrane protein